MNKRIYISLLLLFAVVLSVSGQKRYKIPSVYSNLSYDAEGNLLLNIGTMSYILNDMPSDMTLENLIGNPQTTATGIYFDFKSALNNGTLYFGLIPYDDSKYPLPVYFRTPTQIMDGKAFVNLHALKGRYDMVKWVEKGKGVLGYRVVSETGEFLYDGRIGFKGSKPLFVDTTIVEGPFVNLLTHESVVLSLKTNISVNIQIEVGGEEYSSNSASTYHEIPINGLSENQEYKYTVHFGTNKESYSFKTAPKPGSRTEFTFGYASDSRSGQGGGERDFNGANAYIMKKIMALGAYENCSFMQFTGDLITGYKVDPNQIQLEYANWKRAVEPWGRYIPLITTMGNHEAIMYYWALPGGDFYSIDKFPFNKISSEAIYAENFVNPLNGPESEDGSKYDPSKKNTDFPSYKENVFYYMYDNVAMVVLNSNYWYAPSTSHVNETSGNIHAYIMDNQLNWMEETLEILENDENIDHVFVTVHTPFFPNGGHVNDDMWYKGQNSYRPYVNGKPVDKGIIERRDDLLDVIVNKTEKVVAILTGDEHNYCKTHITPETTIYPETWDLPKLELKRSIYQINNGAAGAPYYSQEITPWTSSTSGFTTQNALVLFHVNGKEINMEVINPDTLDEVDKLKLK